MQSIHVSFLRHQIETVAHIRRRYFVILQIVLLVGYFQTSSPQDRFVHAAGTTGSKCTHSLPNGSCCTKSLSFLKNNQGRIYLKNGVYCDSSFPVFIPDAAASSPMPPQLRFLLHVIDSQLSQSPPIGETVDKHTRLAKSCQLIDSVGPLIDTKWNQDWPYNSLCPTSAGIIESRYNDHTAGGCVAVAMAQLLKYYNYPQHGYGSHSYSDSNGTHSADFSAATYEYDKMPSRLHRASSDEEVDAVASLIRQCGISVQTEYGPSSGADFGDVKNALVTYFGYSPSMVARSHFPFETMDEWFAALKQDIDKGRPLLFSANGSMGHAFIVDGYKYIGETLFFHVNWGWGGEYDGYFNFEYLTVGSETLTGCQQGYIRCAPAVLTPPENIRLAMEPWPPQIDWDPVPEAVGYAFEWHLPRTQSVGAFQHGPDSTGIDIRSIYNMGEQDTLKVKVCSVDTSGLYSSWGFLTIVKEQDYRTHIGHTHKLSQTPASQLTIGIGRQQYLVQIPRHKKLAPDPILTLFSPQGRKITSIRVTQSGSDCLFDVSENIAAGSYFLQVTSGGKHLYSRPIMIVYP